MSKEEMQLKRMTKFNMAKDNQRRHQLKRMTKFNMAKDDQRRDAVKKDDQS